MRRWWLALGALVVAACSSSARAAAPAPPPLADPARPAVILSADDEPNPFVLVDRATTYLYASQPSFLGPNIQVRSGPDIRKLGPVRDAMPELPPWAVRGFTWAPDVRRIGTRYVLWFTAGLLRSRPGAVRPTECIGVATSSSPTGPFVAVGDQPSICQLDRWGSIDPRTFVDRDGSLWLHWKSDDNAQTEGVAHSSIYAQRLSADGLRLSGTPTKILEADQPWEGRIVEAPQLVRVSGHYWLFYSGNWFNQPVYGIGVAACDGPAGPCRKPLDHAWLGSNAQGAGPGESSLFRVGDRWWIVYGPWAQAGKVGTPRPVALAGVGFGPLGPYVARP